MDSIKMILMNLSAGQQQRHRHREKTVDMGRWGKETVDKWREQCGNMHITICTTASQWEFAV